MRMKKETSGNAKAYSSKYITESKSDDEGLTNEEILESYRVVIIKWEKACRETENLKKIVREFHHKNEKITTTVTSQGRDVFVLISKLKELEKSIRILNKA